MQSFDSLLKAHKYSDLTLDTRVLKAGDAFVALKGGTLDGKRFIDQAVQKGAALIIMDEQEAGRVTTSVPIVAIPDLKNQLSNLAHWHYNVPLETLTLVGITGTNGKTSCAHFTAQLLHSKQHPCGMIGTLGVGFPEKIFTGKHTTPDPITLFHRLSDLHKASARVVTIEVSSHALAQNRIKGLSFEVAVFTNLTHDHLDYHDTMEQYWAEKKRLFVEYPVKFAVVNIDDPYGHELFEVLNQRDPSQVIGVTVCQQPQERANVVYASKIKMDATGIHAHVDSPWGSGRLTTSMLGQFTLRNVLASLASACLLGEAFKTVLHKIKHLQPVPGRMESFWGRQIPRVIVDYAHTPDALEQVLVAIKQHHPRKVWCVFGCGGERDKNKRSAMTKIALQYADYVILTEDNSRGEALNSIFSDMLQGLPPLDRITVKPNREDAIYLATQIAKVQDIVLIAGKGHETTLHRGSEMIAFCDADVVQEALRRRTQCLV